MFIIYYTLYFFFQQSALITICITYITRGFFSISTQYFSKSLVILTYKRYSPASNNLFSILFLLCISFFNTNPPDFLSYSIKKLTSRGFFSPCQSSYTFHLLYTHFFLYLVPTFPSFPTQYTLYTSLTPTPVYVHMHMCREYIEVRISCLKLPIILIQDLFCKLSVLALCVHIFFIPNLQNQFMKRFLLL